jgi:hypothetical protein
MARKIESFTSETEVREYFASNRPAFATYEEANGYAQALSEWSGLDAYADNYLGRNGRSLYTVRVAN